MASLQKQYEKFHGLIKLGKYEEEDSLREKRDLLIDTLKENLKKIDSNPQYVDHFNQGSYALGTAIKPKNGDYDIDVGVELGCKIEDYDDPVELKKIVYNALTHQNRDVSIRRSCVTASYKKNGVKDYHVDLAIYARDANEQLHLAKGREHSKADLRFWQKSDPNELMETIKSKFQSADRAQFRRCVRYLKHWRYHRDVDISSIALTSAAYHWLSPDTDDIDNLKDNQVLLSLVEDMLDHFIHPDFDDDGSPYYRLQIALPHDNTVDLLESLTANQMKYLKSKLDMLKDKLALADSDPDIHQASKTLQYCFGDTYFPLPPLEETAKLSSTPYIQSGSSA